MLSIHRVFGFYALSVFLVIYVWIPLFLHIEVTFSSLWTRTKGDVYVHLWVNRNENITHRIRAQHKNIRLIFVGNANEVQIGVFLDSFTYANLLPIRSYEQRNFRIEFVRIDFKRYCVSVASSSKDYIVYVSMCLCVIIL